MHTNFSVVLEKKTNCHKRNDIDLESRKEENPTRITKTTAITLKVFLMFFF